VTQCDLCDHLLAEHWMAPDGWTVCNLCTCVSPPFERKRRALSNRGAWVLWTLAALVVLVMSVIAILNIP